MYHLTVPGCCGKRLSRWLSARGERRGRWDCISAGRLSGRGFWLFFGGPTCQPVANCPSCMADQLHRLPFAIHHEPSFTRSSWVQPRAKAERNPRKCGADILSAGLGGILPLGRQGKDALSHPARDSSRKNSCRVSAQPKSQSVQPTRNEMRAIKSRPKLCCKRVRISLRR